MLFPMSIDPKGNGCVSVYVGPAICWLPVQGVPCLSPNVSWDYLFGKASECPLWICQGKYYTTYRECTEPVCVKINKARGCITLHTQSIAQLAKVRAKA